MAITVGLQDDASPGLDRINKNIARMTAPAERFNRSLSKFGEVTGINRVAEGMQTLGDRTLGAARSAERLLGPMMGLTSLASLGGLIALEKQWSATGTTISKTANLLRTPISQVSALDGAARIAHSSAAAMESSLQGLGQVFEDVKNFKADAGILGILKQFNIKALDSKNAARTAADAMGDVAEAVSSLSDPRDQGHLLDTLHIDKGLLPLLSKGRKGLEDFLAQARSTGGVMTAEMAANAEKMDTAWAKLGLTIEGFGNHMADSWSGTATRMIDATSSMIKRAEDLADTYPKTAKAAEAAAMGFGALRIAPYVLRAMGWLLLGEAAAGTTVVLPLAATVAAGIGAYKSSEASAAAEDRAASQGYTQGGGFDDYGRATYYVNPATGDMKPLTEFLGTPAGGPAAGAPAAVGGLVGPRAGGGTGLDAATSARAKTIHDGLVTRGMDSKTAWGFAGNAVRESRAMWNSQPGDNGAAHGLFMWRDSADGGHRLTDYVNKWGHLPEQGSQDEQLDNVMYELKGREAQAWSNIQRTGNSEGEKAAAVSEFYERPKDTAAEESRRWATAQALAGMYPDGAPAAGETGTVRVDVHLHGAPPGTTVAAVASGLASVTPPRVETSMPLAR
jgi:hypothetical protein